MATAKYTPVETQPRRWQDLQELLTEVGLSVDYWLPKLQEDLGVTCVQALQYLEEKDLQKLKSQTKYTWEKKALQKLFGLSQPNTIGEFQETPGQMIKNRQRQAGQALQELRALQSQGKQRREEAVRRKEAELRQAMEIPEECWPRPEVPLKDIIETMERQLQDMEQKLTYMGGLPPGELLRWASGGLALQGIYKTCHQKDLVTRREELLSVPKDFFLFGSEQEKRMETKEFTSSKEESLFIQSVGKLGFRAMVSAKGGCWRFSLEDDIDQNKHSESKDTHQSYSEHSYFCSAKFSYVPLASFHFPSDQLQLSTAALKELKIIEEQLEHTDGSERFLLLRNRTEKFFNRFGSHANQGPLHLGGIYCWKAISEGFKSDHLDHVKWQTEEALDNYMRQSSSSFADEVWGEMTSSGSYSIKYCKNATNKQLQIQIQLSVAQIGGPPEANGIAQWTNGLLVSNKTWSVIDRELHLVPVWDIILSNHRSNFRDPFLLANCLEDNYSALTGLAVHIQASELLIPEKEAGLFLEDIKSWEVSDPEKQLQKLLNFMQTLAHETKGYDIWINRCLTNLYLQNFLINTANFCKNPSIQKIQFIKSQFRSLLEPHVNKVKNFPQARSIMEWLNQKDSEEQQVKITQLSEFLKRLKEIQKPLVETNFNSRSPETVEEVQKKVTCRVITALESFLNYHREAEQPDMQLLLLSIAAGAGYRLESGIFQPLLGSDELTFLLDEIQTVEHRYQELKTLCTDRAQAFLVLKSLTTTAGVSAISSEEKAKRLSLIHQHMEHLLSTKVAHVLTKFGTDHDWETLENNLKLLIDGNYANTIFTLQMDEVKTQSLNPEEKKIYKKQNNENTQKEIKEYESFLELLQRLGLEQHYIKKMSRADFHLIYKNSVYNTQPRSEQELPFYFLQKLLMLDCGFRHLVFKNAGNAETQKSVYACNQENEAFDPYEELFGDRDEVTNSSATESQLHIHPMDIQMAIFHCVDDLARQYILTKLSICQFALPLVVPNPNTSQMEFSLWSLRQIRRSWQESSKSPQEKNYSHKNQQMCCVSTPIVSFIRVGNGLSASKSQIMNSLLSKSKHDVFFHRHCRGSSKHCLLMEGVVEISWFCPGGQREDMFDKCVAFINLHGDAKEHRQQLSFLQDVSSLIVILMSASEDNKENQNLVRHLCQSLRPVLCLIDDKEKSIANNSGKKMKIGIRNRNDAELREEITNAIKHLLELSGTTLSLEDCSKMAKKQGFLIDEDKREIKETKEKAQSIMDLLKLSKLPEIKENLLPLQGQLWHHWCKKDKELYHLREKGNLSIEQHKSEIEIEKQKIRCQQYKKAIPLNHLMGSVLEILKKDSEIYPKLYLLHWLSVGLENLTSGHLENLHAKQQSLWSMLQEEKQRAPKSSSLTLQQKQIEDISTEILNCTLGIEHLLREIGQIYEALEETSSSRDSLFLCLPQMAADLMIAGVPVELMEGDASYVPLKWVSAVFDKISEKVGDKKLFVLSILGLQSSGKSTLLNALFGLQFTVSAGRCTKGAYMQLLKVEETFTEELGFDFVLVVDTEGLRAPEINNKSQNRDNELATFVIGLGNLTLINIFGENPSEMQDILQIVVQAFLRMKQVKISPSCIFVHQNVGEVTAKDQTMEGRRRLEQRLDEMTALAAEQEECPNITCFNDVIKFDVNSHVYYFAHLWDGNPPMAPPNPLYSHNVQELKSRMLLKAQQELRGRIMKISDVKFRVQDLWKALVSENFIFNFRNTQEVIVMSKLESMYNHWTWELRSHVLELQIQLNNQIQNGKISRLTTNSLESPVNKKYETIKQEFNKYFEEDTDREILIQWKANFEHKLLILKDALISDTRRKGNELISLKETQERLDNQKSHYENELLERSRKLALDVKGKELTDEELHEKFNQLWTNWIHSVSRTMPPVKEPDIDLDSENILLEYFKKEKNFVERLKVKSGEMFEINYSKHVQMKKKHIFSKNLETRHQESINKTTNNIFSRNNETIKNIWKQKRDYSQNDFHEILRIIENELKSVPPEEDYTFTRDYTIDISLCLFQRAAKRFKEIHKAFKSANDPLNYLERKKDDFFLSFKISCQGATSITSFVDFLWLKLTPAISATIWEIMGPRVAGAMRATCSAFNGNRANLENHILYFLAEEENFDKYWQYIHHPKSFFRDYISDHIRRYCSEKEGEKLKISLKISLDVIKNAILSAIHESTAVAKDKTSTASYWLDSFCNHLESNLIFPRKDLISIQHQEIKDTEFFKESMNAALHSAMRKVEEDCSRRPIDEMVPDIEKILFEHLCGCWNQCPFCKAICTNTIPQHEGDHSVSFHRPQAVSGWHYNKTDYFTTECCTTCVASDRSFIINDLQKFPYKKYREAGGNFATWSITPDSSTQPYWKWFICRFRWELEDKYGKRFTNLGTIPDSWNKITKQEVLDDLENNCKNRTQAKFHIN